jgi:glutamine synthetase type III
MTSTWAMKKKANGTFRARLNARGYEQIDGIHYDSHNISVPVTNDVTIRVVLTLMIMADWVGEILDVKGAFLHGDFKEGKKVYKALKNTTIPCTTYSCFFKQSTD